MTINKIIGFSLLGLIALYFFKLKTTVSHLNYYVAGYGLDFDGITPILRIDLGIQNPDQNSFTLRSIVGDLSANGQQIASLSAFDQKLIAPLANTVYPLYFRLQVIGIVNEIISIFNGNGIAQRLAFAGTISVDNLTAPLTFETVIG